MSDGMNSVWGDLLRRRGNPRPRHLGADKWISEVDLNPGQPVSEINLLLDFVSGRANVTLGSGQQGTAKA